MDWQVKIQEILAADTDDLRELAEIAGAAPERFFRDANFRKVDLSDQRLSGLDLSFAELEEARISDSDRQAIEVDQTIARLLKTKWNWPGERDEE